MPGAFVETVRIERFGCVRDAELELTRLHALIGPNDSGKSTVLAALRTASELIQYGEHKIAEAGRFDPRVEARSMIRVAWHTVEGATELGFLRTEHDWTLRALGARAPGDRTPEYLQVERPTIQDYAAPVRGATLVRWEPDVIRRPCELIPEGEPLTVGEKGERIPALYEALLSRDRAAFDEIEAGVRQHFPTVKSIWLPTSQDSKKALGVTLRDGTRVHADVMSEGLLYWLAFAILPHIDPTALLLIEEPENGLHPARIAEVVKALRVVSRRMQVVLATHSPLVINELQPEEVTILTRDPALGTRATRMDRTKHFEQRQSVYALGELWLSYADGVEETELVDPGTADK